jgi:hypothetical protein
MDETPNSTSQKFNISTQRRKERKGRKETQKRKLQRNVRRKVPARFSVLHFFALFAAFAPLR